MLTQYLNTDLVLVSQTPLDLICVELGRRCHVLYNARNEDGDWQAIIESGLTASESAVDDIDALLDAAAALSTDAQAEWGLCKRREFDIGFQAGATWNFKHAITNRLMQRIATAGCSLAVTIYAGSSDSE